MSVAFKRRRKLIKRGQWDFSKMEERARRKNRFNKEKDNAKD